MTKATQRMSYTWEAHIPRGSGDAEYHIMLGRHVIAIVDPHGEADDPAELAEYIAQSMNAGAGGRKSTRRNGRKRIHDARRA